MDNSRIESIARAIEAQMGGDFEVRPAEVTKNNGLTFYGFTLIDKAADKSKPVARPTAYYDPEWDDSEIISHISGAFRKHLSNMPQFSLEDICNKSTILEKVYPVFINKANNSKILETAIWRDFLDMAIIYKMDLEDTNENNHQRAVGTITINQSVAEYIKVVEHELYEAAFKNIENKGSIESLTAIILKMQGVILPYDVTDNDGLQVVSNDDRVYGAAQILNHKIMAELDSRYPQGCYAIPSSIHEMIIAPCSDGIEVSELLDMVKCVNSIEVAPCEVLTDNIYHYRNGEWEVAEV